MSHVVTINTEPEEITFRTKAEILAAVDHSKLEAFVRGWVERWAPEVEDVESECSGYGAGYYPRGSYDDVLDRMQSYVWLDEHGRGWSPEKNEIVWEVSNA